MTIEEIQNLVIDSAQACGLDFTIAFYQIQRESNFNPSAVGADGEKGIAQFTAGTWARFGSGSHDNAFDPRQAMAAYCRYMTFLLGLFNGDYEKALVGYNGGEGHLTDPQKYGPPSARALAYGRELMSQARAQSPNIGIIEVSPSGYQQSSWPTWALIGLAGVVLWSALSD